ncbi:MAG: preprotein translocase subunit SecG [Alphaproteobacteria bacterium]|nr:preprotein translocase subunit SecG [Alphaproteobacteria bacterium]
MFSILLVLLIIVAVFMTGVILLQKSEGSGMSGSSAASMFGGALTGAAAGNFLTKLTTWLAVIFFVLCAALALVSSKSNIANPQNDIRAELVAGESGNELTAEDIAKDAGLIPADTASERETNEEPTSSDTKSTKK